MVTTSSGIRKHPANPACSPDLLATENDAPPVAASVASAKSGGFEWQAKLVAPTADAMHSGWTKARGGREREEVGPGYTVGEMATYCTLTAQDMLTTNPAAADAAAIAAFSQRQQAQPRGRAIVPVVVL